VGCGAAWGGGAGCGGRRIWGSAVAAGWADDAGGTTCGKGAAAGDAGLGCTAGPGGAAAGAGGAGGCAPAIVPSTTVAINPMPDLVINRRIATQLVAAVMVILVLSFLGY
jgi:hypothetical protein